MEVIENGYLSRCRTYSDIWEHLPTLSEYASQCETIVECGCRSVVSSYAFAHGLLNNGSKNKQLISVDLNYSPNLETLRDACNKAGINFIFIMANDIKINLDPVDFLFIDTLHTAGHLRRELNLHASKVNKYIVMHDTFIDGPANTSECIRNGWNIPKMAEDLGYTIEDLSTGLQVAIDEFILSHPDEWIVKKVYDNNNGLTILERIGRK